MLYSICTGSEMHLFFSSLTLLITCQDFIHVFICCRGISFYMLKCEAIEQIYSGTRLYRYRDVTVFQMWV